MTASSWRLLAATTAAVSISAALGGASGPAGSFLPALGALVALGGWLSRQTPRTSGASWLALLLLVPAVGARMWGQLNAEVDVPLLQGTQAAQLIPRLAASGFRGVPAHLAGAAAGLLVLGHRRLALPALGGALAAGMSDLSLLQTAAALDRSAWTEAAWWARLALWTPLVLAPLLAWTRGPRAEAGLWLTLLCCTASVAISPLPHYLSAFHHADAPGVALPSGPSGRPVSGPLLWEGPAGWGATLAAAGLSAYPTDGEARWCRPERRWSRRVRLSAQLALPADAPLHTLAPLVRELHQRSIAQVSLHGRGAAQPGLLGATMAHPGAAFVLDQAPDRVPAAALSADGVLQWDGAPPEQGLCVLRPDLSATVQVLYDAGRRLGDPGGLCDRKLGLDVGALLPHCL